MNVKINYIPRIHSGKFLNECCLLLHRELKYKSATQEKHYSSNAAGAIKKVAAKRNNFYFIPLAYKSAFNAVLLFFLRALVFHFHQ